METIRAWRSSADVADQRRRSVRLVIVLVMVRVVLPKRIDPHGDRSADAGLPALPYGDRGIVNSVNELLWERFGYGPAAIEMIRSIPSTVSASGCSMRWRTTSASCAATTFGPTTRRKWFRIIVAELGLLGSVP